MSKAAPDVDLKSRGITIEHIAFTGLLLAGAVYMYQRSSVVKDEALDPTKPQEEVLNPPYSLIWMFLKGVYGLFIALLILALVLLLLLVYKQRTIIYVPTPPGTARCPKDNPHMYQSPESWGLPYEDVYITTEDGVKVNAWLVYQKGAKARETVPYTFVYFHGNAGNIGHRLENIRDMHEKLKANILILDYRAYGESEDGDGPTERGFMLDAMATYRWLVDRIRNPPADEQVSLSEDRILLFGRSIGGVVASRTNALLLQERLGGGDLPLPAGTVLENTFTSLRDMAVQIFPFLYFLKPILRWPIIFDEWNALGALEYTSQHHKNWCCCLFSGLQDQLVPPEQMKQLHSFLKRRPPTVLKLFRFRDGGHNDTPTKCYKEYWDAFQKFMSMVVESEEERKQGLAELK